MTDKEKIEKIKKLLEDGAKIYSKPLNDTQEGFKICCETLLSHIDVMEGKVKELK